jgi:predicted nucleotidyltransferase
MQDFQGLLHRLADSGLEFIIIGGYAAVTYGSSLVTRDLDICAALSDANVEKLRQVTDAGVIDILSSVLGVGDFARLKQAAEDFEIGGRVYHVIALEDLIAAKEALGREKDLLAAKELRAIASKRKASRPGATT